MLGFSLRDVRSRSAWRYREQGSQNGRSKPFQYHAFGVKPFRIPSTEKYTIEKVKPLQGQPAHIATNNKVFTCWHIFLSLNNAKKLKKMTKNKEFL